jgi:hypothetical protein
MRRRIGGISGGENQRWEIIISGGGGGRKIIRRWQRATSAAHQQRAGICSAMAAVLKMPAALA